MPLLRFHQRFAWLAVFGWLAQSWAPVALAAMTAHGGSGAGDASAWCGRVSPALTAEIAKLPPDLRQILLKGSTPAPAHATCAQACAASTGSALPPAPVVFDLAPVSPIAARLAANTRHDRAAATVPPARGPPAGSS